MIRLQANTQYNSLQQKMELIMMGYQLIMLVSILMDIKLLRAYIAIILTMKKLSITVLLS